MTRPPPSVRWHSLIKAGRLCKHFILREVGVFHRSIRQSTNLLTLRVVRSQVQSPAVGAVSVCAPTPGTGQTQRGSLPLCVREQLHSHRGMWPLPWMIICRVVQWEGLNKTNRNDPLFINCLSTINTANRRCDFLFFFTISYIETTFHISFSLSLTVFCSPSLPQSFQILMSF